MKGGEKANTDNSRNRGMKKIEGVIKKQKWHQKSNNDEETDKTKDRGHKRKEIGGDRR